MSEEIHNCNIINKKPASFFFQEGVGQGKKVLILGESLARNGWVESGKAFYTTDGKIVPTGKKLNEELKILDLSFEKCAFTELAKCYLASNRKILKRCGLLSGDHLFLQIKNYKIKLVISLGVVTKDVLGEIFDTHLEIGKISEVNFKKKKFFILPIYHPSPASPYGHAKNLKIMEDVLEEVNGLID